MSVKAHHCRPRKAKLCAAACDDPVEELGCTTADQVVDGLNQAILRESLRNAYAGLRRR